jgi:plastocyanin
MRSVLPRPARRLRGLALAGAFVAALAAGSAVAQDAGPTVTMQPQSFAPAELHVAPGTSVTWTNPTAVEHTVTADDGSFDSGNVEPGAVFAMEFDTPGRYQYYCQQHGEPGLQDMAGTIVVDDPGA